MTDTGRVRPVMTVERHELRKVKTTSTVRMRADEERGLDVLHRVADPLTELSRTMEQLDALGQELAQLLGLGLDPLRHLHRVRRR